MQVFKNVLNHRKIEASSKFYQIFAKTFEILSNFVAIYLAKDFGKLKIFISGGSRAELLVADEFFKNVCETNGQL